MDGLLLDKIHNSLEACFSVDERIGEKVWAAGVVQQQKARQVEDVTWSENYGGGFY